MIFFIDFFWGIFSPMGVVGCSLSSRFVEGTKILVWGTWLVLATLTFGLEKNLQNLKPLGGVRGGAMTMASIMAKRM